MRHNTSVTTMAAAIALALALLVAVLLPSDSVVHAADPAFPVTETGARSIPENTPPGVNIGAPVLATDDDETDLEFGNTLTYSLSGTDAASFDIDPSTGQLITKAPLNFEVDDSYSVTVTVDDGETRTNAITHDVTISVTDDDTEAPAAPLAPTVVSGSDDDTTDPNESTTSLKVVWHAPENTGPAIVGYAVQYKEATETSFGTTNVAHSGTATTAIITGLEADTSYQVRVRATNGEADTTENWSLVGTGSTNKGNNKPPAFIEATVTRDVDEHEEAGQDVGRPVRATDDGVLPLTYELGGPDADLFDFNPSSSQIRTKRGVTYNHEDPGCGYIDRATPPTQCVYRVTVTAFDGAGGSDAEAVAIEVDDVPEAPGVPRGITVRATEKDGMKNSRSLDVSWNEPENPGPPITGYDVRYRQGGSGSFTTVQATDTSVTIAPTDDNLNDGDDRLMPGVSYEVYVRAKTDELDSQFSARATGRTSAGNRQPKFNDRPDQENRRPEFTNASDDTRVVNRAVNENTQTGQPVGDAVSANDQDTLTYNLIADTADTDDVSKFGINKSTGRILTKDPLNHEDTDNCEYNPDVIPTVCTYKVQVEVWDGLDEHGNKEDIPVVDDTIKVTIAVVDTDESPLAPAVTVTSPEVADGATTATLTVTWNAPANMSTIPPLTSYEVECSGAGITTADPCPQPPDTLDLTAVQTHTIDDLTPGSPYTVRVRAVNDEGVGAWSTSERQSTSKAGNEIPTIVSSLDDLQVAENTPGGRSILSSATPNSSRVEASNNDGDGRVTYRLDGPDKDRFTIDANGQIKTRSSLDFEEETSYTVRVKVSDNDGGSIFQNVLITVTDVDEPPVAPAAPRVTATKDSGWSLEVTWNEPRNTGPAITDYDIRYRKVGDTVWQDWPYGTEDDPAEDSTERKATIDTIQDSTNTAVHLEPRTQYEVEVRAKNGEGDGDASPADADNWSRPGRGTTGQSNNRPTFVSTASLVTLRVDENTRSGQNVGAAVEATDADRNRLTYSLEGPGKDSFTIVSSSGQIRTTAVPNYEERSNYWLTVKVDDGQRRDNSVAVKSVAIVVDDVEERPFAPSAPRVTGIAGSTDSVRVTWDEPTNTGPPIIDYDVRCVTCPGDVFHDGADRSTIITGLTPGTRYAVEVRANNGELTGEWSRSGTGSPNPDVANQKPIFSPSGARSFQIAENASSGDPIGDPVTAVDPDLDPVTHTLEGADATSFDIDPGSGQIRVDAELNHEGKSRHSVRVKATDTRGGSATVAVTITVTDVDEPPSIPSPPTVTAVSSTSLQVSWVAPDNTGPRITDYDYRYQGPSDSNWTEITNTTITAASVTIDGLTPSTFYDVQVRATNAEGTSGWSISGNGATNAPGANNLPVFSEGTSATRSVSANAPPGTNIGDPVTATDADSDDTLTYRLEGRDEALFDIDSTNGQLRTRTGITLLVGTTYTVVVAADDGRNVAKITVSIEATAAPPNALPAFSGGPRSFSVREGTPAGTAIGSPVTATDADPGDTVTHTLEGTDAASFSIDAANGQIRTSAALNASTKSTYSVTVKATDSRGGTATIAVTITVIANRAPVFSEGATAARSVAEDAALGTAIGSPVSATDADGDTVTYSLEGTDAASFSIDPANGQIRTNAALDASAKVAYSVTVRATDGRGGEATIAVTITVTARPNSPPVFDDGTSTTRSVVEPVAPFAEIGSPVAATDAEDDTLSYSLEGTDAASFFIDPSTGQLFTRIALSVATGASYSVIVVASDGEDTARITVTINVTPPPNNAPAFTEGAATTRSIPEGTPAGRNIGDPVTATDADTGDTVTYSLEGTDAASFAIDASSGQIQTSAALDASTKSTYSVIVVASDGKDSARITVTITVTVRLNSPPVFPEGESTTRSVVEPVAQFAEIGSPVAATDADDDTLTYSLGGADAALFRIDSQTGQLSTRVALSSIHVGVEYIVTVTASDGSAEDSIEVTITVERANRAPEFVDGASTTRSVVENSSAGANVGDPVEATDADDDTLTYSLGGADAALFRIDSQTGQLSTRVALSSIHVGAEYIVTVTASDGSAEDSIEVTITVERANRAPEFVDGASTTRSVIENASVGGNVGDPVEATDADDDSLSYSLEGTDAGSFTIDTANGQIRTSVALDAATKSTYTVVVVASDGIAEARITVTITVTALPASFGCATNGAVSDASNTGLVSDCEALLRSRSALEGSMRLNWSAFTPIENWEGVYLRGTPTRVTWLILRRRGLDGTVPVDLGRLDGLTILNLHSNSLRGSIPAEIGNLTNLQRLLLHNNRLSGDFPDLSGLSNLTHLWLSGTNQRVGMGGGVPTWINRLTSLEELNLWGNEMGGQIPNLSGLSNLKVLKLQNNSLTGNIPAWFGNMNSLGGLYLHANDLSGTIPPELGRLTRLRRLWLDRNELSGSIPPALSGMSNLGTLNLHTNRLTGSIPPQLGNLSRLQHLAVHNNALTGIIPTQLGNLGELTRLAVSNNRLIGAIPSELGDLDKLRLLWLSQNQLTGTIPSELGDLGDTLTNIKLANNNFDANACVPSGIANVRTNDYSEAGLSTCS